MANNFLLEIGLEEIPAHVVTPSINQLKKRASDYLKDQRITFDQIKTFSTPRRLTLYITGLADKQPDIDKSVKGPAKKIAQDTDGNWTKAAIGFSRGQGATTDDITFKEVKGTDYVFVEKHIAGKSVDEVLTGMKDVITAMTFPTMMKWANYSFEYVRPIKWLVALLNDKVIPFTILDVSTDRVTSGHRFLGKDVELANADEYEEKLTQQFVIADAKKRKELIVKQIHKIAEDNDWQINLDPDLLEEVNNLVEWPTAFAGKFNEKYLKIPDEVLVTSMKDHQRFFYVTDGNGTLLPHFISVRNGNDYDIQNVIAGNEKVLTARLEDAMFFYEEDQKKTIAEDVERLKKVSFHDKISTMFEKMQRVQVISNYLGKQFGFSDKELEDEQRAAEIYKFDLVTGMVGEFAELQGVMGEKYALLNGEAPAVAKAISEHYMPISANGALPASNVGALLAVSDKLDSILTFFAAGMIPSGSNDPYALRRQATGIVRIVADKKWNFDLIDTLKAIINLQDEKQVAPKLDQAGQITAVSDFIKDRIKQYLDDLGIRYDISDAVTSGSQTDILFNISSGQVLQEQKDDDAFKSIIESLTRVLRISKKGHFKDNDLVVDGSLFENESEKVLNQEVASAAEGYYEISAKEDFDRLSGLKDAINAYFDATMVMDKDEKLRDNHLRQLTLLSHLILHLGDLDKLVVKG
ncbi:glycine--tRNA ligase subunit beta [Lentilactobacillus hilgardii]|uniref:glycine--tRNA ligase subunit beta n=1 Tax=Lentilactobacillus hilgardii TaxID=1588 RepID=UPI0021C27981|nr:glycine--tRNA ligase subunit beta [Lentilactobacillus hilgardii]MCP9332183.1 glycine--tRNA ligase subunit beta [Lentilactobacillus hilgardii]MCP9348813.1 glycine--tRNA ligase subunit beta [Lentilactobacillus hilgardii]MCP9351608.1 glycine--tRNA ligase subunit beta [Lentilactobacillus hilgardii]